MGSKPRILCVDDEPRVLDGLKRGLRTKFNVTVALGGQAGIDLIDPESPFEVIISDMRMPDVDGVKVLSTFRARSPNTVRILLTGQADMESAIAVVNEGNIFRFLTKPCPAETLADTLESAVEQYRLITAEKVLLEQTLHGSVDALTRVMSLMNPEAFGRGNRIKELCSRVATSVKLEERWPLEVAAMMSQVGAAVLPPELIAKVHGGEEISHDELRMLKKVPKVVDDLLSNIPRLEKVRDIVLYQFKHFDGSGLPADNLKGEAIPLGARILKIAVDYAAQERRGRGSAGQVLAMREGFYDPDLLELLLDEAEAAPPKVLHLTLNEVVAGMLFVEDVRDGSGVLLVAQGQTATPELIQRLLNFAPRVGITEPINCHVPPE